MSVNQMNTTNGVVVREVLLDQSNYARFRDFLKTKMVDEKIEDEAVEICFRVVKTVDGGVHHPSRKEGSGGSRGRTSDKSN